MSCARVLRAKQRLGLFQQPYRGLQEQRQGIILTAESRRLAREAAAKACVLLKNDGVLPLTRDGRTIALVGPLADSRANMQGTWAVAARAEDSVTVLEGLRAAAGDRSRVLHAKGTNIVDDPSLAARLNVFGHTFAIAARAPEEQNAVAVAIAQQADVRVTCVHKANSHEWDSSTVKGDRLLSTQGNTKLTE